MFERWWKYQQERFPVVRNSIFAAIFSSAAVCYSLLLRHSASTTPSIRISQVIGASLIAFLIVFLYALQLQVMRDWKLLNDRKLVSRDRPSSVSEPLPINSLELSLAIIGAAAIQLGFTLSLGSIVLLFELLLLWSYLILLRQRFFSADWLKARSFIGWLIDSVKAPLVAIYATSCDWAVAGVAPSPSLIWLLLISWLCTWAIAFAQILQAAQSSSPSSSYLAYPLLSLPAHLAVEMAQLNWRLGQQRTVILWLCVLWLLNLIALLAAVEIRALGAIALISLFCLTAAVITAWRFLARPMDRTAKWFERIPVLWSSLIYLSLGIVPLVLQSWTHSSS